MHPACKPPEPRLLLATDLDGTLIDSSYRVTTEERRLTALLQAAGTVIALVTSKTLDEARIYAEKLRLDPRCPGYLLVAEEGAVVEASHDRLLPGERLLVLAEPLSRKEALSLVPSHCRGDVRTINELTTEEVSRITGLPPREAEAARKRRHVLALHGPRGCLEETYHAAREAGLYARLGPHFLMLGRIRGKAWALREAARRSPLLRHVETVALGDSEMDREMLEEADTAVVVPRPEGRRLILHRGDYLAAPTPAPEGWEWAARKILWRTMMGLASGSDMDC